jgi:lipoprotein-anchoring transpeptidase ErfK/SrfK
MLPSRLPRLWIPGLLVIAVFVLPVLFLLGLRAIDSREGESSADLTPRQLRWDVREDQADVFRFFAAAATEEARLHPTPTPEPTPTPAPSPQEIALAELPYAVPPPGVAYGPEERWVAVDVTTQRAYAFVGGKAVRVALVTTGMPGFETPTGEFHIFMRVENETMDSETIRIPHDDPLGYYLKDVYFTQYFYSGVALHYNYWQPQSYFGNVASSHGCVGMLYDDAKFFWDFARYGTRVVVYK